MLDFPRWKLITVAIICLFSAVIALPNFLDSKNISNLPSWLPNKTVNLGLDLRGGSQLLLDVDFNTYLKDQRELLLDTIRSELRTKKIGYSNLKADKHTIDFSLRYSEQVSQAKSLIRKVSPELKTTIQGNDVRIALSEAFMEDLRKKVIDQSIEIVRRRVDETGTKEPSIQRQGENAILLQVPGLENPELLKKMLGKTAKLTFHLVDENGVSEKAMRGNTPPGTILLPMEREEGKAYYLLKKKVVLSGDVLINATAGIIENSKAIVSINFNPLGARQFGQVTKENVGKLLAIVLDNKIISMATINEPIMGGAANISGNFTVEEANELALLLRAGALPAPLTIIEERTVGPNLGSDSIEAGKKAALVSMIFVCIFMLATYGKLGLFANIALLVNLVLILAALSLLQATLTMPGIAGIILTMGMAVDANVLIFERIREEIKLGITPIAATDRGFNHAFTTILDSNLTTIIVAILLYSFGSGVVKGFAVTLTIGIIASMFSAITLTKLMMITWLKTARPSSINI